MGTINHSVLVLVGSQLESVRVKAVELLGEQAHLVSPVIKANVNTVETLVIATSGSKVGWGKAEARAAACNELVAWAQRRNSDWCDHAEVTFWEDPYDDLHRVTVDF